LVLAQELVPGIGAHDLTLNYPGLRLPEPLALEIARQYAEMLTILHAAGLTCADRKLADLRWEQRYRIRAGSREDLLRFQNESPGRLMVLDWNVTAEKTDEAVKYDLFRFGILWHRILLGEEPRFLRGGEWRLKEPLPRHKLWGTLSHPTRQILAKLLHFSPEQRYSQAVWLLDDLENAIALWKMPAETLWRRAEEGEISPAEAFAAADVMRVRVETWGEEPPPNLEKIQRQRRREIIATPSDSLREALSLRRWRAAKQETETLKEKYAYHPAMWLHLDRLAPTFEAADHTSADYQTVNAFVERSEVIFAYDQPDEAEAQTTSLGEDFVNRLHGKATVETSGWKKVYTRLWREAAYRLALYFARQKRDEGHYAEAGRLFQAVLKRRQELGEAVCERLDMLYSDPTPEAEEIKGILSGAENLLETVRTSLGRLGGDDSLEAWRQTLWQIQSARHERPTEPVLDILRSLLETEEAWRQSQKRRNPSPPQQQISLLKQLYGKLKKLQDHLPEKEQKTLETVRDFQKYLDNRRKDLRNRIVEIPLPDSLPVWEAYRQAFPDDTMMRDELNKKLSELQEELRQSLPDGKPTTPLALQERVEVLRRLHPQAETGIRLAELIEQPWPEALMPETIEKEVDEYAERWRQVAYCLERY
ncbi:hypothetical protein D6833_03580, partial [Candidatus Parcubacteria bacterium]